MTRTVIRNGAVVTLGTAGTIAADVVVEDGRIAEIGRVPSRPGDQQIDASGCWVLPGLVQTHVHLCQTLFRGLAEDLDVVRWLDRWIWPMEQALDADTAAASARWGLAQMLLSGTTSFNSMETALHTDAAFAAAVDLGARATIGKALMDRQEPGTSLIAETTDEAWADLQGLVDRWHGSENGRIRAAVAPRAPSAASAELWSRALRLAGGLELTVHTHVNENRAQAERVASHDGGRDVEVLEKLGALGPRAVLAHCVWLTQREADLIADAGAHIAHCPTANLKLGSGIAPIPDYVARGINVSLGTDGAACNNSLDALHEARTAALIHRPRFGPDAITADQALRLATLAGARALGLDAGVLEPGKQADILLLRTPEASDAGELTRAGAHIVYSTEGRLVDTVLVAGRVVVEAAELAHASRAEIERDAFSARRQILRAVGTR